MTKKELSNDNSYILKKFFYVWRHRITSVSDSYLSRIKHSKSKNLLIKVYDRVKILKSQYQIDVCSCAYRIKHGIFYAFIRAE